MTARLRAIAIRWGWNPDHLTAEQIEEIEQAVRDWAI